MSEPSWGIVATVDEPPQLVAAFAAHHLALLADAGHALEERDGVEVEHVFRRGVVAEFLVVAGEAEHVADAQGPRAEHVGLRGDAVAVSRDHLHDGLHAFLHEDGAGADAGAGARRVA